MKAYYQLVKRMEEQGYLVHAESRKGRLVVFIDLVTNERVRVRY